MIDKFKIAFERFKKSWWIVLIVYILLAVVIIPPMIYASFNIKTKLLGNNTIFDFPKLYKEGSSGSFSKLVEIAEYDTNKIPDKDLYPIGTFVEISGAKYIFKYYFNALIVLAFGYIVILFKNIEKKNEYEDIEHGSSDWADEKEIYSKFTNKNGIILAEKIAINMDTKVKGNKNVLVVGNTGSGKSAGFVKPNVMQNLGSYVFTDPKGELFDYSAKYFESQGYDIKVLNLKNPKQSDGYNPILNAETDIDLDVIARTIVLGQQEGGTDDPYFTDNAQVLLKALIRFLKETRPESEQNLTSCANLVRATNASDSSANMLLNLMQILPEDHLARKDYESVSLATDKAFSSIASTLQSLLSKFETPEIAALTSTNTINFADIGRKKTALYVISSDTNSTFDFLLTIFFSQMLDKLYEEADQHGGALQIPVVFFLDEFANIGKIPDFDRKIATARSRRLSFNVILQSLEQLENIYGNSYETIVGNCDTHLFLGSTSSKTLEYFSKALGEKTIKITHKGKEGEEDSSRDQKLGRYLMTPDEIRRLPYDECLIFTSGVKPIKTKKYFYFNHRESQIPEKFQTDYTSYTVDRGYWNAFSLTKYQKEAQQKDMSKIIQGSLSKKTSLDIVDLSTNKGIENLGKNTNNNQNNNYNSGNNPTQGIDKLSNNSVKPEMKGDLNLSSNNGINNLGSNETKLNFNLGLDDKKELKPEVINKNDETAKIPEDHIDNITGRVIYEDKFRDKIKEHTEEEKQKEKPFSERSTIDETLKFNLNTNLQENKYTDEAILSETDDVINPFPFENEGSKDEIKRNKKTLGLKDINKEHLKKKMDKDNEEKEIERNLEEKFQKLFGNLSKEK